MINDDVIGQDMPASPSARDNVLIFNDLEQRTRMVNDCGTSRAVGNLQKPSATSQKPKGSEENEEADADEAGEAHRASLLAVLTASMGSENNTRRSGTVSGGNGMKKLALLKLEKRIAPRYMPF
ncbi:MAG: hypothetical protein ACE5G2_12385 [Candidatus Krumholzibacteriia bacterium]